jgi:hypothetical protein
MTKIDYPFDLWKEISLHCPYNFFALNKTLQTIYDESWFRDKLTLNHKNSLKSGNIRIMTGLVISADVIPIKGIKLVIMKNFNCLILTFDGDLFYFDNSRKITLIDTDVKDVTENFYIKNYEPYRIHPDMKTELILIVGSPILSITTGEIYYGKKDAFIATENTLYYINDCHVTNSYQLEFKCKKMVYKSVYRSETKCFWSKIILQDTDGYVYHFSLDSHSFEKIICPKVKEVYPNFAKLTDGRIIMDYDLADAINIYCGSNNLRETSRDLLLIDNKIYQVIDNEVSRVHKNIINIGRASDFHGFDYVIV